MPWGGSGQTRGVTDPTRDQGSSDDTPTVPLSPEPTDRVPATPEAPSPEQAAPKEAPPEQPTIDPAPAPARDADVPRTLVGISFEDEFRAREFLTAATRLAANGSLALEDAVLVVKASDGSTVVQETTDPQPAQSALSGAVWAGLFGLILGGPVGWIAGAAVGAGAGAVTAKVVDLGISDEWVGWFREAVQPGTATVALLVSDLDQEALITEARRFTGAELVYANLDEVTLGRIRTALASA